MKYETTPQFGNRQASSRAAARAMSGNKASETEPELMLRRALWHLGLRYRLKGFSLPGRPDLTFLGSRVVVFCDGDFWHGRNWPTRKRKLKSGSNADYWVPKIEANRERDDFTNKALQDDGWIVIRVWESEIRADVLSVAEHIANIVRERREDLIGRQR